MSEMQHHIKEELEVGLWRCLAWSTVFNIVQVRCYLLKVNEAEGICEFAS